MSTLQHNLSRRDVLKLAGASAASLWLASLGLTEPMTAEAATAVYVGTRPGTNGNKQMADRTNKSPYIVLGDSRIQHMYCNVYSETAIATNVSFVSIWGGHYSNNVPSYNIVSESHTNTVIKWAAKALKRHKKAVIVAEGSINDVTGFDKYANNIAAFAKNVSNVCTIDTNAATAKGFFIQTTLSNTASLEVRSKARSNGANVQINDKAFDAKAKNAAELWIFTYNGDGTYTISPSYAPNMALDVRYGNIKNGSNIQLYNKNGTDAQKWILMSQGSGFTIASAKNPQFCIDVSGGNKKNGTNVQLYRRNSTKAQEWRIIGPKGMVKPLYKTKVYVTEALRAQYNYPSVAQYNRYLQNKARSNRYSYITLCQPSNSDFMDAYHFKRNFRSRMHNTIMSKCK